jgi:PKD repeat protein
MKFLSLLFALFLCSYSASSQIQLNITGTVVNAPGSTPVYITVIGTDSLDYIFTTIMTDADGAFSYSTPVVATSGNIVISLPCNGMIWQTQVLEWGAFMTSFSVVLTYCDPLPACNAEFWAWNDSLPTDSTQIDPYSVYIINISTGADLSYYWEFGDGSTSTEAYPQYYYAEPGTYTLCLTISNADCTDTQCLTFTMDENGVFDGGGAAMQGFYLNVVPEITLAINEVPASSVEMNLFPNPASENATLLIQSDISQTAVFDLVNMQGQKVYSVTKKLTSGNNQLNLNVNELAAGNYMLRMSLQNGHSDCIQIIKQ